MRLLELDLRRWGPFTDRLVDLAAPGPAVHIIYGPNEAGKSSALRALTSLFYEVPMRSVDNFLHDYAELLIGARVVNADGDELAFLRRKGRKNTLLSTEEKPLADGALADFLPRAVTRETFENMYALGHERLREAGDELAQGSGDLGEILFTAGAGIADLKSVLQSMQEKAEKIFLPRGSVPRLNCAISRYDDLTRDLRDAQESGEHWQRLRNEVQDLRKERDQAQQELTEQGRRLQRMLRLKEAIPRLARRQELREELAQFGDVPDLREGFEEEYRAALQSRQTAVAAREKAEQKQRKIAAELEAVEVPEGLLQRADAIERLAEDAVVAREALDDRTGLQAEQDALKEQAARLLRDIGREVPEEGPEAACYPAQDLRRVQELAGRHSALRDSLEEARSREAELARQVDTLSERIEELPPQRDADPLRRALGRAARAGDLDARLAAERETVADLQPRADAGLCALACWQGSLEELQALTVPMRETINEYADRWADLDAREKALSERRKRREDELRDLDAEIESLTKQRVATEQGLHEARAARDELWQKVRPHALGPEPAPGELVERLEAAGDEADDVADRLYRYSTRVARLNAAKTNREQARAALEGIKQDEQDLAAECSALQAEWSGVWDPTGIEPRSPREMGEWREARQELLSTARELDQARRRIEAMEQTREQQRQAVGEELSALDQRPEDLPEALADVLQIAEEVAEGIEEVEEERRTLRNNLSTRRQDLAQERKNREELEEKMNEWHEAWGQAVVRLDCPKPPDARAGLAVVENLEELRRTVDKRRDITRRIEQISGRAEQLGEDVEQLCGQVAPDLAGAEPLEAAAGLRQLLKEARNARRNAENLHERLEEQDQALEDARTVVETAQRDLRRLADEAGCEEVEDLADIVRRARLRAEPRKYLNEVEAELRSYTAGGTIDELADETAGQDTDELTARIEKAEAEQAQLADRVTELGEQVGSAERDLESIDGSEEAARRAAEREEVAAQVAELAEEYAVFRLAARVLIDEVRRYRDANQGPIVKLAGEYFHKLTCGRYDGLLADYEQDSAVLKARREGAPALGVTAMSDGTRDQLYLALRLAFIEQRVRKMEPLPLVLDDVLVHFDDERSCAALEVFAGVADLTQVIFFTHHRHLLDLARGAVPADKLCIHELGD